MLHKTPEMDLVAAMIDDGPYPTRTPVFSLSQFPIMFQAPVGGLHQAGRAATNKEAGLTGGVGGC
jgi:hypothetical protein